MLTMMTQIITATCANLVKFSEAVCKIQFSQTFSRVHVMTHKCTDIMTTESIRRLTAGDSIKYPDAVFVLFQRYGGDHTFWKMLIVYGRVLFQLTLHNEWPCSACVFCQCYYSPGYLMHIFYLLLLYQSRIKTKLLWNCSSKIYTFLKL